ncbi:Dual specificity phosphatase catalytic domain/Protein-tyrosine phosphatase [Lotmaria passim]
MGNRISTSASPLSLEDLEAIARSPPPSAAAASNTATTNATPSFFFDAVTADLVAAVSALNSSVAPSGLRKSGGTPHSADNGNASTATASTTYFRKENIKAELEQQFTDVETSLHALRCVPDLSRGRRLPPHLYTPASTSESVSHTRIKSKHSTAASGALERRGSRHSDPVGGSTDAGLNNDADDRTNSSRSPLKLRRNSTSSARATKRRANSLRHGGAAAVNHRGESAADGVESPQSWIFRDVAVQPLDLTQAVDIASSEVYVVVVVQRATAMNGSFSPPANVSPLNHSPAANVFPPSLFQTSVGATGTASLTTAANTRSSSNNANASGGATGATNSAGARSSGAARTSAVAAASSTAGNTGSTGSTGSNSNSTSAEWPRDMVQVFTPRGLATLFSSDFSRPSSGAFLSGTGNIVGASPSATPRTNGSTSNRPTPRSGGGAAAPGSPRSASSLPTPRASGFHYSIHLLTGKQADALTAAAGFLVARSIEKLFLDCPDFDRRLFYHLNILKAEEAVRAYYPCIAVPEKAAIGKRGGAGYGEGAALDISRGASRASIANDGAANAGVSSSAGGGGAAAGVTGTFHNSGSGAAATIATAGKGGIQRGLGSGSISSGGGVLASVAQSSAGVSQSSSSNNLVSTTSGVSKGYSLYYITAAQEAAKELLRELLAAMRPLPVVAPRFRRASASPGSAQGSGSSSGGNAASNATVYNTEMVTVASSNPAELYSMNALFRVLSGVRVGTPRWSHGSNMTSPLSSARFTVPNTVSGGASGSGTPNLTVGMSSWHHDLLPPFRPPRRGLSASAADAHGTSATANCGAGGIGHTGDLKLPLSASSWLQGPQPLDVHAATTATTTTTTSPPASLPPPPSFTSPNSTTLRCTNWMPLPRSSSAGPGLKSKPRSAAAGHPYSPVGTAATATPPQLPLLALSSLEPKTHRPTMLNVPPKVTETATPSLVTTPQQPTEKPRFTLPLDALLPKSTASPPPPPSQPPRSSSSLVEDAEQASRAAAAVVADGEASPLKHPRSRSYHPTSKRAEAKSSGASLQTRQPHAEEQPPAASSAATNTADGAVDFILEDEDDYNEVITEQERARRLKAAQPEVTEVLPYLFVGGELAARDRAQLLLKGITHVVNTVNWCLDSFYPDAFHYLTLNLNDAADEPIFSLFAVVNAFVEKARRTNGNNGRVFVHCQQGVSRSCTFVIAYVMWKQGLCYDRAYELVRARRNVCSPNMGFVLNLRLWEAHLTTPQLNSIYAFAPYTSTSPTPFVYQLVSCYDCATVSTAGTDDVSQASRANYYQLCSDVLHRVKDYRGGAAIDSIVLDPRMCYVFLCAPRRTSATPSSTADGITAKAKSSAADKARDCVVEACFLVGATCTQKECVEQAFAAYGDLLQYGFYHGDTHASIDNAGRTVTFAPLRRVCMVPAWAAAAASTKTSTTTTPFTPPSSYSASAAATVKDAQALFARHVNGRCRIEYVPQPQWETLLSLPGLAAKLTRYVSDEDRAVAAEAARHTVREAELAKMASGQDASKARSSAAAGTAGAVDAGALTAVSPQLFNSSRLSPRAPRTPRRPQTTASSSGLVQRSSETVKPSVLAHSPPSPLPAQVHANPRTNSPSIHSGNRATVSNDVGSVPQADQPPIRLSHVLPLSNSQSLTAPQQRTAGASQGDTAASPVKLSGGDNFAFAYPFDAASKAMVADLDDLESDECYAVGFQQASGVSVYLWRGAECALEVHEVVSAFVNQMVKTSGDQAAVEAIAQSVESQAWTTCTLRLPGGDSEDGAAGGGRGNAGVPRNRVLRNVRVLFVEQGEEPKEFVTLL